MHPGQRTLRSGRERVVDADAARHWLQQQSYVAADRISLIGWANGGVAALWTVRPRAAKKDDKPDFRSAIAFYPGCRRLRDTAWSARMPTLILVGAQGRLGERVAPASRWWRARAGARARAAIQIYPERLSRLRPPESAAAAAHQCRSSTARPRRVHVGTDPVARADAMKRVAEWLAR